MQAILKRKHTKMLQKQFNGFFEDVNSFIGNVYKSLSRTPQVINGFMNQKHKRNTNRHRHRTR